jgi:hypothetical protein
MLRTVPQSHGHSSGSSVHETEKPGTFEVSGFRVAVGEGCVSELLGLLLFAL